ncbi:MAG TPA: hypothetical protein OIM42_00330 [Clostridiaceae bacterium]|jgi:hypothetical protein|nr:hypothetical protein [Clostridiaceae bacterium]
MKLRKVRYKSSTTVLDKIHNLSKISEDYIRSRQFHVALNEGITEWIAQKTVSGYETYDREVNIVKQIENIVGAKNIIEIVNKRPKELKDLLNMNKKEFITFSNQMEYIYFLKKLKELYDRKDDDKYYQLSQEACAYLNDEIKTTTLNIQTQLIKKLIIPYFENKQQNNSENLDRALKCMELIKDYFYINDVGTDVFEKFMNTDAPKELKDVLDKIVIQYAKQNFQSIDKWDNEKIFEMDQRLSMYGYVSSDEYYDRFTNKIASRIEELRLIEDASIIERVKKDLSNRSRIDVKLLANNYVNEYSSIYINKKVRELILKRNLTESQDNDLIQEIQVYRDCGKIISKKDIKRQKSDDGHIEYFVMIDGKKYTNEHLKKMKYGRKFLDSKRYEVINEEKEDEEQQIKEDEEQQSNEDVALSVLDEKKQGKLAKFIDFFKKRFSKKKNETIEYKTDSHVGDFRASLKVQSKRTTSQSKQEQSQSRNFIEKDEI